MRRSKHKSHLMTRYFPVTATNITMNYINTPHKQCCFLMALGEHHSSLDTVSNGQNIRNQRLSTCKQHLTSCCNCALLRPLLPLLPSMLTRSRVFHTRAPNVRFLGTQITKQRWNPKNLSNPLPLPLGIYFLKISKQLAFQTFCVLPVFTGNLKTPRCTYPVCIIVQHDKVSVAHVESRQVITSIFGIKNVFIDHVGCSSSFGSVSTAEQDQF